jgi:hypothetical protein
LVLVYLPVIKSSAPEPCSSNDGASLWIGKYLVVLIGPLSSIGSPMTFIILPRVAGPTGTIIGFPVSLTSWPLMRPSVESKAMVLTLFPPKCWATSSTSLFSTPWTSRALRIGGRFPSNCTSTTAPITWEILPMPTIFCEKFPIE